MATEFSLTGQVRLDPRWVDDLNTTVVTDSVRVLVPIVLANGDGDGEADVYWRDVRTAPVGGTDFIDLANLPLSVFGGSGTVDMATVRLIYIRNLSDDTAIEYQISGGSAPQLPPGGVFLFSANTASAVVWLADSQLIEISPVGSASADYEIVLVGVQAT